jgi:predicted nucleotidyltransferase
MTQVGAKTLTNEQEDLLSVVTALLAASEAIEAAWLAGSLGRGVGDAFSDIDILALAGPGQAMEASRRIAEGLSREMTPVLLNALHGGRVLNVVTPDWGRFDISFAEPPDLARYHAGWLTPLFNRGSHAPPEGEPAAYRTTPAAVLTLVNEFFRVLGLLAVGVGRREWVLGLTGVDLLRRMTIDLMLEENGVGPGERGGALRRDAFLTEDQRRDLAGLSPVRADRAGIIAANAEVAAIFLPRARRLAATTGARWPAAFEAATRRHLHERVGLELP